MSRNIKIYYLATFLRELDFSRPIWMFFFMLHLGFSMGWSIFITTLIGLTSFVFEIPTGSWADRFGRKNLYISGVVISMLGGSFYLWAHDISLFVISAVIMGFGAAIMSGNIEALIHDDLVERWEEDTYPTVQTNGDFFFFSGRAAGCLLGGVLYVANPLMPFALTLGAMALTLPILLLIHEPKQALSTETTDRKHIAQAFSYIWRHANLVYVLLGVIILSSIGNIYWFSYQPYLDQMWLSIVGIGIAIAVASGFSAVGSMVLKGLQKNWYHETTILQYLISGFCAISLWFYFSVRYPSLLWMLPVAGLSVIFWFVMALGNSYVLRIVPPTHKSASLSIFSFGITLGYFIIAWPIWFFIDAFSLRWVYWVVTVMTILLALINYLLMRRYQS